MKKNFTDSVLKKIHAKKITPRERSYFIAKTVLHAFVGIAFLVFGMLSIALVWHLIHNFAFVEFILERPSVLGKLFWFGVPLFWMVLAVALWIVTEQVVQRTGRAYRIPLWIIGTSVLFLQILGGFALEQSQVGERMDAAFEQRMEWYQGAERMNRRMERMPENGFLVGTVLAIQSETLILLNDMTEQKWEVQLDIFQNERAPMEEGMKIRMVGEMIGDFEFRADAWRPARKPLFKGEEREYLERKGKRGMRPPLFQNK